MAVPSRVIEDMFNSMLRSDYIPLRDDDKLRKLKGYYVNYMGCLRQVLADRDQLVVGRRGTGKTTLLYRALVECMESWTSADTIAAKNTLGIYIDVSKCQSLAESGEQEFISFEMAFVSDLCNAITDEIARNWPAAGTGNLLTRLFRSAEARKRTDVLMLTKRLAEVMRNGIPTLTQRSGEIKYKTINKVKDTSSLRSGATGKAEAAVKLTPSATLTAGCNSDSFSEQSDEAQSEREWSEKVHYKLSVSDILRLIGEFREQADISSIYVFVDEFSALSDSLQRRFSTLLRKILGNQRGLYVKLCAITDNYALGSSIILQRDLFEIPLDLDALVERSESLNAAMVGLASFTKKLVEQRLGSYTEVQAGELFEDPESAYRELSRAAMGVPRTLGLALIAAWNRAQSVDRHRISRTDVEYGIKSASRGYVNQLTGASKGSVAIPSYVRDIWEALIERAVAERSRSRGDASHFMLLPKHQEKLRLLNMFFVVHLLTAGRTTKKDSSTRSLYCLDYGQCLENNLGYGTDKNVIRQQRFAYDDVFSRFDHYFRSEEAKTRYVCPKCNATYTEDQLTVAGMQITFCPKDKEDLVVYDRQAGYQKYTEEEVKIIGDIKSLRRQEAKVARQIADDVGCYSQKVGKFGEKLEREGLIKRTKKLGENRYVYYSSECLAGIILSL